MMPEGRHLDVYQVLGGFAVVRVLTSFIPLPSGIGVLDVGLIDVLVRSGLTFPQATAALAMYRLLTFVLPILGGALCAGGWRISCERRTSPGRTRQPGSTSAPQELLTRF